MARLGILTKKMHTISTSISENQLDQLNRQLRNIIAQQQEDETFQIQCSVLSTNDQFPVCVFVENSEIRLIITSIPELDKVPIELLIFIEDPFRDCKQFYDLIDLKIQNLNFLSTIEQIVMMKADIEDTLKDIHAKKLQELLVNEDDNTPKYFQINDKLNNGKLNLGFGINIADSYDFHDNLLTVSFPLPDHWKPMNFLETLIEIVDSASEEFGNLQQLMCSTIRKHHGNMGGVFTNYSIEKIERIQNASLYIRHLIKKQEHLLEKKETELMLFHGCAEQVVNKIIHTGFDVRKSKDEGMFGTGIYLADKSSKSNQYSKCEKHKNTSCKACCKKMFVCRALLGDAYYTKGKYLY